jgi:hypothetical protein
MKTQFKPAIAAALFLLLAVIGCKTLTEGKPAAEKGVASFLSMLNEGKFEEIFNNADDGFKNSGPKEDTIKFLTIVNSKLGKVVSTSNQSWKAQTFNMTSTIVLLQSTEFENGKGEETFTFVLDGDNVKLLGYNINSMDMMLK